MKRLNFLISTLLLLSLSAHSQVITEWRNGRTGIYNETGLLQQWPEEGPKLLWHNDSLPAGHSSVSIAHGMIYFTGIVDTLDVLVSLDMQGNLKWQTSIGTAWTESFPESRCTPTIEGNNIYVSSGRGNVACIDAQSGKINWLVEAGKKFSAKYSAWGVAESLIIKDDLVFFSPVGLKTTVVAMNKNTGETIWQSESLGDSLAYVSPILINYGGKSIVANISANYFYGVDASNGDFVWKIKYFDLNTPTWHAWAPIINCVTPLYDNGYIYITSGYNHVGVKFKLAADASEIELLWVDSLLDTHHGGVVKVGDYIYGSNWIDNGNGNWCCIDWKSGKKMYETKWNCKGSIIANDGMLYCYDEKRGNIALVKADPEKFEPISSFKVPYGKGPYWSHPVIKDGILYVRHGSALMAYSLK